MDEPDAEMPVEEIQVEQKKIIKRAPSIPAKISELKEGSRVAIIGTVVSKNADISSFILDDGEAQVLVLANSQYDFELIKEGQFVRVLGKVWGQGDEAEVQADIVQDFSSIDKELYKKVFFD